MAPQRKNATNDEHHGGHNGTESKRDKTLPGTGAGINKSKKSAAGGSGLKDVTNASALGGARDDSSVLVNGLASTEPGDSVSTSR